VYYKQYYRLLLKSQSIQINNQNQQTIYKVYILYTINYNKLNEILIKENWNLYTNKNVNKFYNLFIDKVDSAISMTAIIKTANLVNKHLKDWMISGLLCSLCNKQKRSLKVLIFQIYSFIFHKDNSSRA
jgi:hypothetical protein